MSEQLKDQILAHLDELPDDQQQRILDYTRTLARETSGTVSGQDLLAFAGTIGADDLRLMARAIDESCERIDPSEW